jgi:predicted enzyme related to lactoylglutathione lyase
MNHPVVWFEVLGNDGNKLQQFYGQLFGWKINTANPMGYGEVDTAGAQRGIPGGVGAAFPGGRPWVTFYIESPDLDRSLAEVERHGGKVLMPPKTISPDTTIAHFQDPEGNVVGLVKAHAA